MREALACIAALSLIGFGCSSAGGGGGGRSAETPPSGCTADSQCKSGSCVEGECVDSGEGGSASGGSSGGSGSSGGASGSGGSSGSGSASGDTTACSSLADCVVGCDGADACLEGCFQNTTAAAAILLTTYAQCASTKCPTVTEACIQENCNVEAVACFVDTPGYTCSELGDCIVGCESSETCLDKCYEDSSFDGFVLLLALLKCMDEECPNNAEGCVSEKCGTEAGACFTVSG